MRNASGSDYVNSGDKSSRVLIIQAAGLLLTALVAICYLGLAMIPDAPEVRQATSLLVRRLWGSAVSVASFSRLAGDASSRVYYRATLLGDAPSTVVVMQLVGSSLSISSDELQTLPELPCEEPFVNVHRYLYALGVPVPCLYSYDKTEGLILLEDLGDTLLWDTACTLPREQRVALYKNAIDLLLTFHTDGTHRPDSSCIAFNQRFDQKLFMWELEHFIEFGLERRLNISLPARERERLQSHFSRVSAELAGERAVLSHRDFHSWNLLVRDGAIYVIDFQDCLLAPAQYDLASLLTDRTTADQVDTAAERELIDYYLGERARREGQAGRKLESSASEFRRRYFLAVLQRALKVIGRFYFLALEKGKTRYLRFIPAEVRQARRAIELAESDSDLLRAFNQYHWPAGNQR